MFITDEIHDVRHETKQGPFATYVSLALDPIGIVLTKN